MRAYRKLARKYHRASTRPFLARTMQGMLEQADLIGAELIVRSAPGQGTDVQLRFTA